MLSYTDDDYDDVGTDAACNEYIEKSSSPDTSLATLLGAADSNSLNDGELGGHMSTEGKGNNTYIIIISQSWKQDQNVKTKTKTIRSRPRPRPKL